MTDTEMVTTHRKPTWYILTNEYESIPLPGGLDRG